MNMKEMRDLSKEMDVDEATLYKRLTKIGFPKVTISRHWENPQIETRVTDEYIEMSVALGDFIKAVKSEMNIDGIKTELRDLIGSVTWVMTRDEIAKRLSVAMDTINLSSKIDIAVAEVIKRVKEESTKVV